MRHSLGLGPRREDNYPGRPGNKKQHRQPGLPQSPDTWNQFHKARKVSEKASFLRKDGKGKLFFVLTQIFLHYFSCQTDIIQPGFYRVDILSSLSPMARLIEDDHSNLIGLAGVLPRSWLICSASASQSTLLLRGRWMLAENRISDGSQVLLSAPGYNGFQLRHYACMAARIRITRRTTSGTLRMVMDGIVFILLQYMQMQRYISMKASLLF